jgi:hypothetical protein
MTELRLTLHSVHDCDQDDPVGGQDLPFVVTLRVEGDVDAALEAVHGSSTLEPFNVKRSKLAGHIQFHTFEIDAVQKQFNPQHNDGRDEARRFSRSAYVRTAGELRAALADLPDDFPLLHTGIHVGPAGGLERENRAGLMVVSGRWCWANPEDGPGRAPNLYNPSWSLRINALDPPQWKSVVAGTRRNFPWSSSSGTDDEK